MCGWVDIWMVGFGGWVGRWMGWWVSGWINGWAGWMS